LAVSAGGRFERFSLTSENAWLPHAAVSFAAAPRITVTGSFSGHVRFPEMAELLGPFPNPALRGRRSLNAETGAALRISGNSLLRLDLYARRETRAPFSEETEWRIADGRTLRPLFGAQLRDSLKGRAHGFEATLERRGANRLAGWIAYSYGHAYYRDSASGLSFDGDFDQRHAVTAYATYRLSSSMHASAKYHYATNFPVAGFYRGDLAGKPPLFWLSEQRNQLRQPPYSLLDIRASKACYLKRSRLTFHAEVLNVLNASLRRYIPFDRMPFAARPGWLVRDTMLPILPTGGVALDF
jgi:outer membrane receptor protein involved in Fe transport